MIKLVIWDWNGTLLADTKALIESGNRLIQTYGGKPLSREQYIRKFDFPTIEFFCNQGCSREELLVPGAVDILHHYYEPRASKCRTRRGAREVMNWLKNEYVDSVILSNYMRESIIGHLHRLGLGEYIAEVLANTDLGATQSGKNKLQRLIDYLSRHHYDPAQAMIIGDSPEDIKIGKERGMRTVGITGGYFSTPRLRASRPDYLITNLIEVIGIVERN